MMKTGQEICEGRFRVLNKIGDGAFGEIYKVENRKNGTVYAAKIVSIGVSNPVCRKKQ
jgi:serine/threonine protein kinase